MGFMAIFSVVTLMFTTAFAQAPCTTGSCLSSTDICDTTVFIKTAPLKQYDCTLSTPTPFHGTRWSWNVTSISNSSGLTAFNAGGMPIFQCSFESCVRTVSTTQQLLLCSISDCNPINPGADPALDTYLVSWSSSGTSFSLFVPSSGTSSAQLFGPNDQVLLTNCMASGCRPIETSPPCDAGDIPAGCSTSPDPALWFKLRNDTCQCPWDCIQCNGGLVQPAKGAITVPGRDTAHTCVCSSSTATMDCRGCTQAGCPAEGSFCDTTVFLTRSKAYSCLPDANLATFFEGGGLFVWNVDFPTTGDGGNGTGRLDCYAFPDKTPLLFYCVFWNCARSLVDGNQKIECGGTNCTNVGGSTSLKTTVEDLRGKSTVILSPGGRTDFFQERVVITVQMVCNASGCAYPGDSEFRQSVVELAVATAVGVFILLVLVGLLLFCWRRAVLLRSQYLNFGKRRLERALSWSGVACTLRFRLPSRHFWKQGERRQLEVLKTMSGQAGPGTMTAIMGESGAGKTALLDVLACRKTFGQLHGDVLVNGREPGVEWRRITGYVLQDDLFIPTVTAREHLEFAANLKLPSVMSPEERAERVEFVLQQMGLQGVADSLIGDSTHKGLSGGEKKRLSIATELIGDPSILFVDEPTSGLDSVNSYRVMHGLHELARQHGKTVIFSIHSPDSRLFELFDQVILLAKGYAMYCGPRQTLKAAMETLAGQQCPANYNPADFAIHTLAAIPAEKLPQAAAQRGDPALVVVPPDKDDGEFAGTEMQLIENTNASPRRNSAGPLFVGGNPEDDRASEALGAYTQPWLWQVVFVCKRSLTDAWRNPYLLRLQYVLILAAALVLGGLFWQMNLTASGAQNRLGLLFFVCILLMVVTLTSIDTFFAERGVFLREKAAGFYSASAYFCAKALSDVVPLRLVPPILLTCIVYPMTGLRLQGASYFFWFMLLCILLSYCSTGLCLLISTLCPSVAVGNLAAILVMLFELLFGGLLLSTESLPSGIAWLKWVSFIFYAYNALMVNEFTNLTFQVAAGAVTVPLNGQFFLNFFGLESSAFYLCLYLLVVQGTVFYAAAAIVLYFRKEKR